MPYVYHRWLGGTLTNFKTVRKSIQHYKDLEVQKVYADKPKKKELFEALIKIKKSKMDALVKKHSIK